MVDRIFQGGEHERSGEVVPLDFDRELFPGDTKVDQALADLFTLGQSVLAAEATLERYFDQEPKIQKLVACPQSADKHAEGPYIMDHYKCIMTAIEIIKNGLLDGDKLPECLTMTEFKQEWDETLEFIKENPNLVLAFGLCHDLGKADFIGIYAKKPSGIGAGFLDRTGMFAGIKKWGPSDREDWKNRYLEIYKNFAAQFPDMAGADIQKKFFDEYGVTVTYVGHEGGLAIAENRATTDRITGQLELNSEEKALLDFTILYHVSDFFYFYNGSADYEALFVAAQTAGLDGKRAIRCAQATMLIDGVLGARKRAEGVDGLVVSTDTLKKFYAAEQGYPNFCLERQAEREQAILKAKVKSALTHAELGGKNLLDLNVQPKSRSVIIDAFHQAIVNDGELELGDDVTVALPVGVLELLKERLKIAKVFFTNNQ